MSDNARPIYPWQRLLRPVRPEGQQRAPIYDAEGYLSHLTVGLEEAYELSDCDAIEAQLCVVLLGESGIGKSQIMRDLNARIESRHRRAAPLIELGTICGYADLKFQIDDALASMPGTEPPTLFLDDFEHCPVADDLEKHLAKALERVQPKPRLRLAVRSGAWSPALHERLQSMWGADNVHVYELCPLRRRDVVDSFVRRGRADAQALVASLDARGAGPLLARPVTLLMLLEFAAAGELAGTFDRRSLYGRAMRRMADHAPASRIGKLDPDARLAVARRIAAISVFCGKYTLRTDMADITNPTMLAVNDALHDRLEPVGNGRSLRVEPRQVVEVLRETGLFTLVSANEVSWRHASFADYLAAAYLRVHQVSANEVRSLLCVNERSQAVPVALEGVAGWLALDDELLWEDLVRRNPIAMLRADVASMPDHHRAILVEALFDAVSDAKIGRFSSEEVWARMPSLAHPGLADQIRARLRLSTSERALSEIVSLATHCRLRELAPELAAVALDRNRPMQVRAAAARAVSVSNDATARESLRPLLEPDPDDDHDELLGTALSALWPSALSTEEMFAALRPPRRDSYLGSYGMFLYRLGRSLESAMLPEAVEWARQQPLGDEFAWNTELVDWIVQGGLGQLDVGPYTAPLLEIFERRITRHQRLFKVRDEAADQPAAIPVAARRTLLRELTRGGQPRLLSAAEFTEPPLLDVANDLRWLIEGVRDDGDDIGLFELLIRVLSRYGTMEEDAFGELWALAETRPQLRERAPNLFCTVLQSERAERDRRIHEEARASSERIAARVARQAAELQARIGDLVAGDGTAVHWLANRLGPLKDGATAWNGIGDGDRDQIGDAAVEWLNQLVTGEAAFSQHDYDVLWALGVIAHLHKLEGLSNTVWPALARNWLGPPSFLGAEDGASVLDKLRIHARSEIVEQISQADACNVAQLVHWLNSVFTKPWPDDVAHAVAGWSARLDGEDALVVLHELFESSPALAEPIAWLIAIDVERKARVDALALLARFGSAPARDLVWSRILSTGNVEGREVVERLAESIFWREPTVDWNPHELSRLYRWLEVEYPASKDPDRTGAFHPGARDHVAALRRGLVEALFGAGNEIAYAAAAAVVDAFPGDEFLRMRLHKMRLTLDAAAWKPLSPLQFYKVATEKKKDVVQADHERSSADRVEIGEARFGQEPGHAAASSARGGGVAGETVELLQDESDYLRAPLVPIGGGAYGRVYRSQDRLGRPVAVKFIRLSKVERAGVIGHAKAIMRAGHGAMVVLYGVWNLVDPVTGELAAALVMEFLEGSSLEKHPGPFTLEQFASWSTCLVDCLRQLHAARAHHGDLHSGNVMITPGGLRVLDPYHRDSEVGMSTRSEEVSQAQDVREARHVLEDILGKTPGADAVMIQFRSHKPRDATLAGLCEAIETALAGAV